MNDEKDFDFEIIDDLDEKPNDISEDLEEKLEFDLNEDLEEKPIHNQNIEPETIDYNNMEPMNQSFNEEPIVNALYPNAAETPVQESVVSHDEKSIDAVGGNVNFVSLLIGVLLKPITTLEDEVPKINSLKLSAILMAIIAGIGTGLNLLSKMIFAVIQRNDNFWTDETTYEFALSNLKDLDYVSIVFKGFVGYSLILLGIAGVYFIGSLILKKQVKFEKLLTVSSLALFPYMIVSLLFLTLISLIMPSLAINVASVGYIYTFLILYSYTKQYIKIEKKDLELYFHFICVSLIVIGTGYIYLRLFAGNVMDLYS